MNQTLVAAGDRGARREAEVASTRSTARAATTSSPTSRDCCATAAPPRTSPRRLSSAPTGGARSFKPERGTHRAWLFGIARNAALDELRRRSRHAELATEPEDVAAAGAHEEAAETALRRSMLSAAMAKLSARERELIALKYFAGLANAEIAAVIGVSESNAGTKLHRAMEKLREACDED